MHITAQARVLDEMMELYRLAGEMLCLMPYALCLMPYAHHGAGARA
jgi:hypothetical protein